MMRLIRRFVRVYQSFIVSGAILVFGLTALVFAVIPGINATKALYDGLKELEGQTSALSEKLSFLESMSEEDLRDRVMAMLSAIPQDKSVPTILSSVEALADQTGVTIDDMNLTSPGSLATGSAARQSAAEKKTGASVLPLTLNASGTYEEIRAFVGQINTVRRLFDVTSFDISTTGGETKVRLSLAAYYQPLPSSVGGVESQLTKLTAKEQEVLGTVIQYPDMTVPSESTLTPMVSDQKRDPFATP